MHLDCDGRRRDGIREVCGIFIASLFLLFMPITETRPESNGGILILAPQSTSSVPLLLMAKDDPIEGIDIETELFVNHPQALVRLLKGEADFLFTGTSSGWENYLDGGPLRMINTGVWGVSYLMGKDASTRSFADLRGKKVALPFPGSPLDFQTRAILARSGIDPDRDLTLSYAPFSQTVPMLIKGRIDAAPLPEPLATDAAQNRGLLRLVGYKSEWARVNGGDGRSPQVSLFVTVWNARTLAPLAGRLVEEWRKASAVTAENPDGAAAKCSEALSMPASVVAAAIANTFYEVPSFEENMDLVVAYYEEVKAFLPGARGSLKRDFFFALP